MMKLSKKEYAAMYGITTPLTWGVICDRGILKPALLIDAKFAIDILGGKIVTTAKEKRDGFSRCYVKAAKQDIENGRALFLKTAVCGYNKNHEVKLMDEDVEKVYKQRYFNVSQIYKRLD